MNMQSQFYTLLISLLILGGCFSKEPEPLKNTASVTTTVKMDFAAKPLPEIPLPNDLATRFDATSPTKRRINASLIAPARFESDVRRMIDEIDGWGVNQSITIPFTGPIDIGSIEAGHRDVDYDPSNDVVYLIDITPGSPDEGELKTLDIGEGNYPVTLERLEYWKNDPRGWTISLGFEEADEDLDGDGILDAGEDINGNGILDPGEDLDGDGELDPPEDTDADGILDKPNYLPGANPSRDDLTGRADALMYFYERETNTLIATPMEPLRERTTYAVVVTKRIKDESGASVGSPYPGINHISQTEALKNLDGYLPEGLSMDDVAFAFSFTTQTVESSFVAVRDGLYGHGIQADLAEVPARVKKFFPLVDTEHPNFDDLTSPYLLYGEDFAAIYEDIYTLVGGRSGYGFERSKLGHFYTDFHAIGIFDSPQLFFREDANGNPLGYNQQAWPENLTTEAAPYRAEEIPFWLAVPRKEASIRGENKMAPLVIISHGYTSNRFGEVAQFSAYFAQHGLATLGIECPSHGLNLNETELQLANTLLAVRGVDGFREAGLTDRAYDQNNDGLQDSGADFWTSYVFHTRDVVRQCSLDHMQLVRMIRSWDGERRWEYDLNGDGENDLAGDFDGDGIVDVGKDSVISMFGASLGGIMSSMVGGLEPGVTAATPIAGGGGLGNIGIRSIQGGVREAVILRMMSPIFTGTLNENGSFELETIVPDLNGTATHTIGRIEGVKPGDTVVIRNLDNGERGCGYVAADGTMRSSVPSDISNPGNLGAFMQHVSRLNPRAPRMADCITECAMTSNCVETACGYTLIDDTCERLCANQDEVAVFTCADIEASVLAEPRICQSLAAPDRINIEIYHGPKLVTGSEHCEIVGGAEPFEVLDRFGADVEFQKKTFRSGAPLVALAQGNGEKRATPGLRRFLSFAQLVLDPADPAVYSRHSTKEPLCYPGTGECTNTNTVIVTTLGDMNVPASSGVHAARAAGYVDYKNPDPRYVGTPYEGLPANQILIDTYVSEAVNTLKRYTLGDQGIHIDVENFSGSDDLWGAEVPRLDPPLRLGVEARTDEGGISGAIFPMGEPTGQHGVDFPGEQADKGVQRCQTQCETDTCECSPNDFFDIGMFMFNILGRYLATGGTTWNDDPCNGFDTCGDLPPKPEARRRLDVRPPLGDEADDGAADDGAADDGAADDGNADDGNADDGAADDGNADDGAADDGNADDGNADDGAADDGAADDGNADDGAADDGNADDGNADDGAADDGAANDGNADNGNADDGAANDGAANDGAANDGNADNGNADDGAADDGAADDGNADEGNTDGGAAGEGTGNSGQDDG